MRRIKGILVLLFIVLMTAFMASTVLAAVSPGVTRTATPSVLPRAKEQLTAAPRGLTAQATSVGVTLVWQDNTGSKADFRIERQSGGGSQYVVIKAVGPGILTFTDTDIKPGMTYSYRVRAVVKVDSEEYYSAYSNQVSVTVPAPHADFTTAAITLVGKAVPPVDFTTATITLVGKAVPPVEFTTAAITLVGKDN